LANLNEILVEVKAVHKDVGKLLQWQAKVDERCRSRGERLEKISDTLYGNPNSNHGLIAKVQGLINRKKQMTESRKFWLFILRYIIAAGIVALMTWLLWLFKAIST